MPRFVILKHNHPFLHWDLMLEVGDALRTWRLSKRPCVPIAMGCESLPDHRKAYLDYEGPVSGGRGCVRRIAAGEFRILTQSDRELVVELCGPGLQATLTLKPPRGIGEAQFSRHIP